jgi:KipI family sensor histidine kinase inhibitor
VSEIRILPAGDRALLVEPADRDLLAGLVDRLHEYPIEGVDDVLPAARTVLVTLAPGTQIAAVQARVRAAAAAVREKGETAVDGSALVIPVRYDGPDLRETAARLGLSPDELIARHTGHVWRCAFVGFAPGFGYLECPAANLTVPRRAQSRTAVPAGAVALAGGYSAVYPRRTPGGWQLIGSTELVLWDWNRPDPALLRPGSRVRFVRVKEQ